eukprot:Rhum_TRINITY_DN1016_c0_g1::Rhum_TRINITY_DN1016_c0_g1_i1::g.3071::m.3071
MTAGLSMSDAERMCGLSMDEVRGIAESNRTPMEKEANDIWKKLDNLAATDKKAYDAYIKEQMEEGKKYFAEHPDGAAAPEPPKPSVPRSVFWVETEVLDGNGKGTGIPRYFNICESETIEFTDDKNLNIYMSDLDNRQVDCVIHPHFMDKCREDNLVMHDTLQMLFKTYTTEHKEKERIRFQYQHHPEPRKLVMKIPKTPAAAAAAEANSAMDVLSKVRHADEAKRMVKDEREDAAKRLFNMYAGGGGAAAAPDPETTMDFGAPKKAAAAAKKAKAKVQIEEMKPTLTHALEQPDADTVVVRVPLPEGTEAADVDLEIEGDVTLTLATPATETLVVPLPHPCSDYAAKYLKARRLLKVTLRR